MGGRNIFRHRIEFSSDLERQFNFYLKLPKLRSIRTEKDSNLIFFLIRTYLQFSLIYFYNNTTMNKLPLAMVTMITSGSTLVYDLNSHLRQRSAKPYLWHEPNKHTLKPWTSFLHYSYTSWNKVFIKKGTVDELIRLHTVAYAMRCVGVISTLCDLHYNLPSWGFRGRGLGSNPMDVGISWDV